MKYTFKAIINGVCYTCERIECYSFSRKGTIPDNTQTLKSDAEPDATAQPDQPNNDANGVMVWKVVEDSEFSDHAKPSAGLFNEFGEHGLRLLRHTTTTLR